LTSTYLTDVDLKTAKKLWPQKVMFTPTKNDNMEKKKIVDLASELISLHG